MRYILMNKNTPILTCEIDAASGAISKILENHNLEYLPVGIGTNKIFLRRNLNEWWKGRSIPASRQGLDIALTEMGIANKDELLTKSFGLSLSDQYWINPNGLLEWSKINFFDNSFSEDVGDILFGNPSGNKELDLSSPDNTSDGWLRKRWKIVSSNRCLIKGGSEPYLQEGINEAFATIILNRLGAYDYVHYDLIFDKECNPYSICQNFITSDTELVTAWQIMQIEKKDNKISEYTHLLNCSANLGIEGAQDFLDYLIAFDYLILNTDRHFGNFGAIRDVNTLKFIGFAPIYDNGTSLWHNKLEINIRPTQDFWESRPFYKSPIRQLGLVTSFKKFDLSKLHGIEQNFYGLLSRSSTITNERRDILCQGIIRRIDKFQEIIKERT